MASLILFSCAPFARSPAILLTDSPEMLLAVELFNSSQKRDFVEIHFESDIVSGLEERVADGKRAPSLVIGKGLRSNAAAPLFQPIDAFVSQRSVPPREFYPGLLRGGQVDGNQVFLPVSFNLLLVMNSAALKEGEPEPGNAPAITIEEIERRAASFNSMNGTDEKMGFSPTWPDRDFLYQWVQLAGAGFSERLARSEKKDAEGRLLPVAWNEEGLDRALVSLSAFISSTNGSMERQDAFEFKHLVAPGYRIIQSGKILFAVMRSDDYFLLPMLDRSRLEYRYFVEGGKLAVDESIRYAGIPKRSPQAKAAGRFLEWFFTQAAQDRILEKTRTLRLSESQFGIAGGLSALQKVTETILPVYYPDMADRVPPPAFLDAPAPMPGSWIVIRRDIVVPWLRSAAESGSSAGKPEGPSGSPSDSLRAAIGLWLDGNPDQR